MSKSNPVHLWRFGRTRTLIFTQKWLNRAKIGVLHGTPKKFLRPNKSVSRVFKTQLSKINWKIKSISSGLVTRRLYFLKKYDTKWPKFPPCRNWPIYMCDAGASKSLTLWWWADQARIGKGSIWSGTPEWLNPVTENELKPSNAEYTRIISGHCRMISAEWQT